MAENKGFPQTWIRILSARVGHLTAPSDDEQYRAKLSTLENLVGKACKEYLDQGYVPGTQSMVDAHGNVIIMVVPTHPVQVPEQAPPPKPQIMRATPDMVPDGLLLPPPVE